MTRTAVRKVTNREVPGAVARRESFKGNSTSGTTDRWNSTLGVLPHQWRELFYAQQSAGRIVYAVRSYATPVAWVLEDGTVVFPPVRYSVTTSKAQGHVRGGFTGDRVVTTLEEAQQL